MGLFYTAILCSYVLLLEILDSSASCLLRIELVYRTEAFWPSSSVSFTPHQVKPKAFCFLIELAMTSNRVMKSHHSITKTALINVLAYASASSILKGVKVTSILEILLYVLIPENSVIHLGSSRHRITLTLVVPPQPDIN